MYYPQIICTVHTCETPRQYCQFSMTVTTSRACIQPFCWFYANLHQPTSSYIHTYIILYKDTQLLQKYSIYLNVERASWGRNVWLTSSASHGADTSHHGGMLSMGGSMFVVSPIPVIMFSPGRGTQWVQKHQTFSLSFDTWLHNFNTLTASVSPYWARLTVVIWRHKPWLINHVTRPYSIAALPSRPSPIGFMLVSRNSTELNFEIWHRLNGQLSGCIVKRLTLWEESRGVVINLWDSHECKISHHISIHSFSYSDIHSTAM